MSNEKEDEVFTWVMLIIATIASFWFQAVLTEERLVPALNVIATHFHISDDVAGATLMAAGASSPELFASIVSLFITHSSLGMGTIIGSEIFNQLVICAGAILAARNNSLKLDPSIVIREVSFYALSLVFLLIALGDRRPVESEDNDVDHIYISTFRCAPLFGLYIIYVLVCANFDKILATLNIDSNGGRSETNYDDQNGYAVFSESSPRMTQNKNCSIKVPQMPFARQLVQREPVVNFHKSLYSNESPDLGSESKIESLFSQSMSICDSDEDEISYETTSQGGAESLKKSRSSKVCTFLIDSDAPKPSQIYGLTEIEKNKENGQVSFFMWQRSSFYNKARLDMNAWQLRWFTMSQVEIVSVPDRVTTSDKYKIAYPPFSAFEVDYDHLLFKLNTIGGRRDYFFLCPTKTILSTFVERCQLILQISPIKLELSFMEHMHLSKESKNNQASDNTINVAASGAEGSPPLISLPQNGLLPISLHIILFPLKAVIHYVVPDVRNISMLKEGSPKLGKAVIAVLISLACLILGSYTMITSLEALANKLHLPDSVIGLTISAAGTSLPNYVASQVAAQQEIWQYQMLSVATLLIFLLD